MKTIISLSPAHIAMGNVEATMPVLQVVFPLAPIILPIIVSFFETVKNFLEECLAILDFIEKLVRIGCLIVRVILKAGIRIAKFFCGDKEVGAKRVDRHNIDEVSQFAEELDRQYG